ncbi:MAG: hypothetical protein K8Q91_02545 [Candidatus Vogelbacteria bacterium]|nr:hypothetical protein [Candidatus Vogelbacteria bacterium]
MKENYEQGSLESIPNQDEISAVFGRHIEGEYKTTRCLEDEQGIYLWEVEVPGASDGEVTEYRYTRKGQYQEASSLVTTIQVAYYENGDCVGGTSVVNFLDGQWVEC